MTRESPPTSGEGGTMEYREYANVLDMLINLAIRGGISIRLDIAA